MLTRSLALRSLRFALRTQPPRPRAPLAKVPFLTRSATIAPNQSLRQHSTGNSTADRAVEDITELYATAQDEFEIAMEETEKMSVYAEEDRKAANAELEKVQKKYKEIVEGSDKELAEEVSRRVGRRIRELEQGVRRMEEIAMEHD